MWTFYWEELTHSSSASPKSTIPTYYPSGLCPIAFFYQLTDLTSERHLFSGNNQKVENKVSGRLSIGVEGFIALDCRLALLIQWGGIHLIIWIKIIIYTQYVIIAYCFIMYYNIEVQIIATICNK